MKLFGSAVIFTACLGSSALAAPPDWRWAGPTARQSWPLGFDKDEGDFNARAATGTVVKLVSKTKATATVTDAHGERQVAIPGSFEARGPVRVLVRFAEDDYFETLLVLPEVENGKPVEVKIPAQKSQHIIAGNRRIPVSRGVKVVTFRDDPKGLDIANMKSPDGMSTSGPRYLRPGVQGADIRQIMFHLTGTDTVKKAVEVLVERSLSTHLLIAQDGTIYQLLDLETCGYHGGRANNNSIGVDIVQRIEVFRYGDDLTADAFAKMKPAERERWEANAKLRNKPCFCNDDEYDLDHEDSLENEGFNLENPFNLPKDLNLGQKDPRRIHPIAGPMSINHQEFRSFGPTPAAMESAVLLSSALLTAFPEIPRRLPSNSWGELITRAADDPPRYGIVGHWHWETQRWDPGPGFDWQALANLLITMP